MKTHSISRWAISLATLFGTLILASCATTPPPPASETTATSSKPYGSLAVGWSWTAAGDLLNYGTVNNSMGTAIYERLTRLTPEGQTVPNIAERWEISPDGSTQTYYIRKGVKFHDGSEVTAADVKFTFERIMGPTSKYSGGERSAWLRTIDKVELKDDYTLLLRMKAPQFEPVAGIDPPIAGTSVVSKKYVEEKGEDYLATHPMGTGPWKVVSYQPGLRLDLEAVEGHWRATPKFKNISILYVPEEGTRVAMLKTGELDIATVASDSVSPVRAAGLRILAHGGASQAFGYLYWDTENVEKYPLGNVKARKALSLSINRKELADKLFQGYAEPSVIFYVQPTAAFWDSNVLKPDPYDPEGAKKLLVEAGYPSGFSTKIWDPAAGVAVVATLNQAIGASFQKIGVNAEIEPVDYSFIRYSVSPKVSSRLFNTMYFTISGGGVWQFEQVTSSYHSGPARSINNPKLDELIEKVPLTKDANERKRMMLEAVVLAKNEHFSMAILDVKTVFAIGSKVGAFAPIKGGAALWGPVYETIAHAK